MRLPPRSTCLDGWARCLVAAAAVAAALLPSRTAHAQACCVAAGLTTPARLKLYESYAVGLQTRVRSVLGSFDEHGSYVPAPAGDSEMDTEEDLYAAVRMGLHLQASLQVPFVQTARSEGNLSGFGGGIGDVAGNVRWDLLLAGDRPGWPGISVLAGVVAPTGRSPDQATDLLATTATGTGSWQGNLGLSVEPVIGRVFVSATGWAALRSPTTGPVRQSFAPIFTALLAGGYAFRGQTTVGAFLQAMRHGDASNSQGPVAGSAEELVTGGLAGVFQLGDCWRLQGTAAGDLPVAHLGLHQPTGVSLSIALTRLWL
jgi:hypothetical protein